MLRVGASERIHAQMLSSLLSAVVAAEASAATHRYAAPPLSADWVVVGGGAGGCAAAATLADGGDSVLLLERGDSDLSPGNEFTQTASKWPDVLLTRSNELLRLKDGTWGAVGNVLGGGTAVNDGLFFNETAAWFKSAFGGVVDVASIRESYSFIFNATATALAASTWGNEWTSALDETGWVPDYGTHDPSVSWKNGTWRAFSTFNSTLPIEASGWPRVGASSLIHSRSTLANLGVVTNAFVHRVAFASNVDVEASGVWVELGGNGSAPVLVTANKGVILSAGAVYTPAILQRSGIGEKGLLESLGIHVTVDLPGVGANFTDRLVHNFALFSPHAVNKSVGYSAASSARDGLFLESVAGGSVATSFGLASLAFVPPEQRSPEFRNLLELVFGVKPLAELIDQCHQIFALHYAPLSRGWVRINSTDPHAPPAVFANYFDEPKDLEVALLAVDRLLRVAGELVRVGGLQNTSKDEKETIALPQFAPLLQKILDNWDLPIQLPSFLPCLVEDHGLPFSMLPCPPSNPGVGGLAPNASFSSKENGWAQWVRDNTVSSYHYFGTAAVGEVLDPKTMGVRGVKRLYVADASVLPVPTRVNPQATVMAMGRYVAKLLLNGWREGGEKSVEEEEVMKEETQQVLSHVQRGSTADNRTRFELWSRGGPYNALTAHMQDITTTGNNGNSARTPPDIPWTDVLSFSSELSKRSCVHVGGTSCDVAHDPFANALTWKAPPFAIPTQLCGSGSDSVVELQSLWLSSTTTSFAAQFYLLKFGGLTGMEATLLGHGNVSTTHASSATPQSFVASIALLASDDPDHCTMLAAGESIGIVTTLFDPAFVVPSGVSEAATRVRFEYFGAQFGRGGTDAIRAPLLLAPLSPVPPVAVSETVCVRNDVAAAISFFLVNRRTNAVGATTATFDVLQHACVSVAGTGGKYLPSGSAIGDILDVHVIAALATKPPSLTMVPVQLVESGGGGSAEVDFDCTGTVDLMQCGMALGGGNSVSLPSRAPLPPVSCDWSSPLSCLDSVAALGATPPTFSVTYTTEHGASWSIDVVTAWAPPYATRFWAVSRLGYHVGAPFYRVDRGDDASQPSFVVQFGYRGGEWVNEQLTVFWGLFFPC